MSVSPFPPRRRGTRKPRGGKTTYDYLGRPETLTYPNTGFRVRNHYNSQGAVDEVWREDGTGALLWKAEDYSVDGALKSYLLGNGVRTQKGYYANSGRLHTIQSGLNSGSGVQNLSYEFDRVGNLKKRQDLAQGKTEEFGYDELYRLRTSTLNGVSNGDTTYDALGNIASKSGFGAYLYDPMRPHAVSQIGSDVKSYDDNGNLLSGSGRTMSWTSFDMPEVITRGDASSRFRYDDGHNRIVQVAVKAGLTTNVGGYERIFDGATYKHRHYVATPAGMTAVFVATVTVVSPGVLPGRTDTLSYQHQDHLGSMDAITDGVTGAVIERQSFDAWGLKRDSGWTPGPGATGSFYNRGFTGHEQLDDLGLVHMNGRIYDPVIGRFLSADPNVQFAGNLQSYNRYSYVLNNPLSFTDPTGFLLNWIFPELAGNIGSWLTDTFGENAIPVVSAIAGAVVGIWGGPVAAGAVSSGTAALLSGASNEDAALAAGEGAAIGAVTAGIGSYAGTLTRAYGTAAGVAFQVVAHAAVGGAYSELMGGSFQEGALSSAVSAAAGGLLYGSGISYGAVNGDSGITGIALRTATAAVVGGTTSVLGGGKFANGAISAAFTHMFNDDHKNIENLLKGGSVEAHYYILEGQLTLKSDQADYAVVSKMESGAASFKNGIYDESIPDYRNNPDFQDVRSPDGKSGPAGPIPEGIYRIDVRQGLKYGYPAYRLSPVSGNVINTGRVGPAGPFVIHYRTGIGCIVPGGTNPFQTLQYQKIVSFFDQVTARSGTFGYLQVHRSIHE